MIYVYAFAIASITVSLLTLMLCLAKYITRVEDEVIILRTRLVRLEYEIKELA